MIHDKPNTTLQPAGNVQVKLGQIVWSYRTDRINPERLTRLLRPCSFDEVLASVLNEFSAPAYQPATGKKEARGYWRAVFCFSVTGPTYDVFFNGPTGYRAQFCEDSMAGLLMNEQCIKVLTPLLVDFAKTSSSSEPVEKLEASLRCRSAKIWIDEHARDCTLNKQTIAADQLVVLNVPRWVQAAKEAEEEIKARQDTCPRAKEWAQYGVQAPEGTRLKVLGGFINQTNCSEFVVPSKRRRHQQIQLYGFS